MRLCQLFDMPERIWRRWQAKARTEIQTQRLPSRNNGGDDHNKTLQTPSWRDPETDPRKPSMTSGRSTKNCRHTTLENMPR